MREFGAEVDRSTYALHRIGSLEAVIDELYPPLQYEQATPASDLRAARRKEAIMNGSWILHETDAIVEEHVAQWRERGPAWLEEDPNETTEGEQHE